MRELVKSAMVACSAALVSLGVSSAAVFTPDFSTPSFPGTQYDVDAALNAYYEANFGIRISNAYFYRDSRDTFDEIGIASGPTTRQGSSAAPREYGRIDFLDTTDFVTLEYWALNPSVYAAYDAAGNLLDSFTATGISTGSLGGGVISYILFSAERSAYATVSGLTYNYDGTTDGVNTDIGGEVPLPAMAPVFLLALAGAGVARRRAR